MSLTFNEIAQLINGSIKTNTTQDIKADILNGVLQELLDYTANHEINPNRIPAAIARSQDVQANIGSATSAIINLLHGGDPNDGLTLDGLNTLIAALQSQINGTNPPSPIPIGLICMWSGTNIPDGWELCDGGPGRPDLSGKFIVGYQAGTDYNQPGNKSDMLHWGAADAQLTPAGFQGGRTKNQLTVSHLPPHFHEARGSGATMRIKSSGEHNHATDAAKKVKETLELHPKAPWPIQNRFMDVNDFDGTSASASDKKHEHINSDFEGITGNGTTNVGLTANPAELENRPVFYTLAYIIKVPD